jgi:hypothetical protein
VQAALAISLLTIGCGGGGAGRIGDPCQQSSECQAGPRPFCYAQATGGYCSSTCNGDGDCGVDGECVLFGALGRICMHRCTSDAQCRPGYACFTVGACLTSEGFDCDPTAGDGSCSTAKVKKGACVRTALGKGLRGQCTEQCSVGTGSCSDAGGLPRQCLVADLTRNADGSPTGDAWKGPACAMSLVSPPPPAVGEECSYPGPDGKPQHYDYACGEGSECLLSSLGAASAGQVRGDDRCRPLCYLPGGGPDEALSASVSPASACAAGATCTDVWGLGSASDPLRRVGLCL